MSEQQDSDPVSLADRAAASQSAWSAREIYSRQAVPAGLEADLRAGMLAHHNGWQFTGHVWHDPAAGGFAEEIFVNLVSQGTRSAETLDDLIGVVSEEFDWG